MIIGITGTDGSGKDTVAKLFIKKLGWAHFSLSDELRDIARQKGIGLTREKLGDLANDLRQKFGYDYLSRRVLNKAPDSFVVTSIRNPSECEPFRARGKFYLVAVDAPIELRHQRDVARNRAGEANDHVTGFSQHEQTIQMDGGKFGQRLKILLDMADAKINNDGTIKELEGKVDALINEVASE